MLVWVSQPYFVFLLSKILFYFLPKRENHLYKPKKDRIIKM
jgi:hypothetical protein